MGEIVSLQTGEIITIGENSWAIELRHSAERPLKTAGSERIVPVHPKLVELGLLDFIDERRTEEGDLLFPELVGSDHKSRAHKFQRHYERFQKRKLGITEKGFSFHSFRHCFRDALREAGVPIDAIRALGGWARSGGVEERYGQGTSPATLAKWMAKVEYPDVNLGAL